MPELFICCCTKITVQIDLQIPSRKITLNCKGRLLVLDKPVVMGIINITPDSFFAGSRKTALDEVQRVAEKMLTDGATILDIGGYSTRPGAIAVPVEEELKRVLPVIEIIHKTFPEAFLSIDTFRAQVAKQAIEAGAQLVNDISAGDDDVEMLDLVSKSGVPYIIMHKRGNPQTMQKQTQYDDVVLEVMNYFTRKVAVLSAAGIHDVVIDPGFGFAKQKEHNYALLNALGDFQLFGTPVMAGLSRKQMIRAVTGTDIEHALNGTTALHTIALIKGADILRVHDVKEAVECIKLVNAVHGNF
jgi:dihydropteroate synthase